MAPAQIHVSECAFHFRLVDIPDETTHFLLKLDFDGEGSISTKKHVLNFQPKSIKYNITNLNVLCRLLAFTFRGCVKLWLKIF